MFSFHSKYFAYRELKRAPQKLSFCFKVSGYWYRSDTGQHTVPAKILQWLKLRNVRHEGLLDPIIDTNKRQPSVVTETKMNPKIT